MARPRSASRWARFVSGDQPVLTLTALRDSEYLISSLALGIDEYYAGVGEAPGVWAGGLAAELGLEGVVDPDQLRALLEGHHPVNGADLLAGRPNRHH